MRRHRTGLKLKKSTTEKGARPPDALKTLGLTSQQATSILNYVNGQRSILEIRNTVVGETARDVSLDAVAGYLELLKTVGWIAW